ncbi:MAG: hypothetical protein LBS83_01415 [Holosporales bacterium]|jgi:hypothetical protein|nr:hypothetical protein [Holosporales bacterium]
MLKKIFFLIIITTLVNNSLYCGNRAIMEDCSSRITTNLWNNASVTESLGFLFKSAFFSAIIVYTPEIISKIIQTDSKLRKILFIIPITTLAGALLFSLTQNLNGKNLIAAIFYSFSITLSVYSLKFLIWILIKLISSVPQ